MSEELIKNAFSVVCKFSNGVKGSALLINAAADLRDLAEKYLKENKEAHKRIEEQEKQINRQKETLANNFKYTISLETRVAALSEELKKAKAIFYELEFSKPLDGVQGLICRNAAESIHSILLDSPEDKGERK